MRNHHPPNQKNTREVTETHTQIQTQTDTTKTHTNKWQFEDEGQGDRTHPAIIIYFRNLVGKLDEIRFTSRTGTTRDGIIYAAHRTHARVITQADANIQP